LRSYWEHSRMRLDRCLLSRPLLETASAAQVTAAQAVVGGVGLMALSVLLEPLSRASWTGLLAPGPLAGLLFLVIAGTFVAYTIYLRLVRDWGAPRAGLYAFVSPVIALLSGWAEFVRPDAYCNSCLARERSCYLQPHQRYEGGRSLRRRPLIALAADAISGGFRRPCPCSPVWDRPRTAS